MADEKKEGSVTKDALLFLAFFAILVVLWYFAGGPGKADLKGLFLAPPAPLGSGEAYGPTLGSTTPKEEEQPPADDGFYLH